MPKGFQQTLGYVFPQSLSFGFREGVEIAAAYITPDHFAAVLIGSLLDGATLIGVIQEVDDFPCQSGLIPEWDQPAPIIGEQLLSVPVGCGYHRLAHSKRIGERTGNNLRLIQVRSDINICRTDKLQQILVGNETIMKNDVVRNAEFLCAHVKAVSVTLPLFHLKVRMGGAYHHIDNLRVGLHDLRQGINDHLNALAWRKQAEGQDDLLSGCPELLLVGIGFDKRHVRDTMVYEDDLLLRHLVDIAQEFD